MMTERKYGTEGNSFVMSDDDEDNIAAIRGIMRKLKIDHPDYGFSALYTGMPVNALLKIDVQGADQQDRMELLQDPHQLESSTLTAMPDKRVDVSKLLLSESAAKKVATKAVEKNSHLKGCAIAGTYVVWFGLDATDRSWSQDLCGYVIRRFDHRFHSNRWVAGGGSLHRDVDVRAGSSLADARPVMAFQWSDYTAYPGQTYTYTIIPVHGKTAGKPLPLTVRTASTLLDGTQRDVVLWNRACTGSQGFTRHFGTDMSKMAEEMSDFDKRENWAEEMAWLSRGMQEGFVAFLNKAQDENWKIRACVYEFSSIGALDEFRKAVNRDVDVKIVFDYKVDSHGENNGTGEISEETIAKVDARHAADEPKNLAPCMIRRTHPCDIHHNKFIVLLELCDGEWVPHSVWTGSTNFTDSGFFGQGNVAHVFYDEAVVEHFYEYWHKVAQDPPTSRDARHEYMQGNNAATPSGATDQMYQCLCSPRDYHLGEDSAPDTLQMISDMVGNAKGPVFITLPFGMGECIYNGLKKCSDNGQHAFVVIDHSNEYGRWWEIKARELKNIWLCDGAKLSDYWGDRLGFHYEEENNPLSNHVKWIHAKVLVIDPFSSDCLVITGSANFSPSSDTGNDENMVVIRGNQDVAQTYFTEFMRFFNHFEFRDIANMGEITVGDHEANAAEFRRLFAGDRVFAPPDRPLTQEEEWWTKGEMYTSSGKPRSANWTNAWKSLGEGGGKWDDSEANERATEATLEAALHEARASTFDKDMNRHRDRRPFFAHQVFKRTAKSARKPKAAARKPKAAARKPRRARK